MNRVIKFRAWDKTTNQFVRFTMNERGMVYDLPQSDCDVVLQQFTGLTDKNGKEIYEGDIITEGDGVHMEIVWQTYSCQWIAKCINYGRGYSEISYRYTSDYLVIGNIYEYPELLNNGTA